MTSHYNLYRSFFNLRRKTMLQHNWLLLLLLLLLLLFYYYYSTTTTTTILLLLFYYCYYYYYERSIGTARWRRAKEASQTGIFPWRGGVVWRKRNVGVDGDSCGGSEECECRWGNCGKVLIRGIKKKKACTNLSPKDVHTTRQKSWYVDSCY